MVIKRADLDSIDFMDIGTGEKIPAIHPGEILRYEFLDPLSMSVNALALALHVPAPRINDVVRGKRAISAETALRLARYFGTSTQFWLNLQNAYDLRIATEAAGEQIKREIEPLQRPPTIGTAAEAKPQSAPRRGRAVDARGQIKARRKD
ncbi:addiction module HigA family antidote [Paraburkholderia sp. BL23I1N1]|uniref:HigA family addiction module antitoxin n=1 Tax=Paraburkholderia sp. BL23I1N1 TaxID=1938802 RepID=UPI000E71430F|nr:HigA family addiction module antitoxin [Paraburkholderia sp. BL23I1N1]RKE34637.1 addiction module HigA family antidote [Paraburkholderia sp. BL23I1N1]